MLKIRKKLAEKKEASKGIAKAGFTLIELLVVLAILAILVLLAAPRFLGYTKDAAVSTMKADAKVLADAALVYNIDNNDSWPVEVVVDEDTGEAVEVPAAEVTIGDGAFTVTGQALNEEVLREDHVQSLSGDFSDYVLVTEKATVAGVELQEGDIVHRTGVKDKDGNTHYAVNVEIEKAE